MTTIEIKYCDPCGFIGRAIETQRQILGAFGSTLDGVTLVPGNGGVFRVRVEGTVVFDVDDQEYDLPTIMEELATQLSVEYDPSELADEGPELLDCSPGCC